MTAMDWVTCKIALAGDITNVIYKSEWSPVSVPELDILRYLHGETAVNEVKFLKTTVSTPAEEKIRLLSIYKEPDVNVIYPGRNPSGMPMLAEDRPTDEEEEDPLAKPAPAKKKGKTTLERLAAKGQTAATVPDLPLPALDAAPIDE